MAAHHHMWRQDYEGNWHEAEWETGTARYTGQQTPIREWDSPKRDNPDRQQQKAYINELRSNYNKSTDEWAMTDMQRNQAKYEHRPNWQAPQIRQTPQPYPQMTREAAKEWTPIATAEQQRQPQYDQQKIMQVAATFEQTLAIQQYIIPNQ